MTETNVMQQEDEVQPCLADLTIGAMGNPKRGLVGYRDSKSARKSVHSFRQKMLNAHRFELTPELIHAVTLVASSLNTATLVTMAENARPCFDNMWIEWDEQVRRDASIAIKRAAYGDDIHVPPRSLWADRVGYLIQNDATSRHWPGDESSFLYTGILFVNAFDRDSTVPLSERAGPTNSIMASPLGYLFSNESPIQDRSSLGPLLDVLMFDVRQHDMPACRAKQTGQGIFRGVELRRGASGGGEGRQVICRQASRQSTAQNKGRDSLRPSTVCLSICH